MPFTFRYFAFAIALTVGFATGSHADSALSNLPGDTIRQLGPGARVERLIIVALRSISDNDRDGDGLDAVDIERTKEKRTMPEHSREQLRQLLEADPNGDGHLTAGELEAFIRAAFAKLDGDGNGVLDEAEYAPIREEIEMANLEAQVEDIMRGCSLPKAARDTDVVAVWVWRGDAQPTVTVVGQAATTYLERIVVEPGERPLYVLLGSHEGTVWKFEGEVDRVKQLVVIPAPEPDAIAEGWAGAGVLGVPKDIVAFTPARACDISNVGKYVRKITARIIAKAVGAPSALAVGQNSPQAYAIPSGTPTAKAKARNIVTTAEGTFSVVEGEPPEPYSNHFTLKAQEDWRATFDGIVEVNPAEVIAPGKVETYEVLPGADGLRDLVKKGVLERTEGGYRLLQPLPRWPAGLRTFENLTFILPKGIPRPDGAPGQAQVIVEP